MRLVLRVVLVSSVLVALATGLFAYDWGRGRPGGVVEFRPASYRFEAPLVAGVEQPFTIRVHNGSNRAVRLVGGAKVCGPMGCASVEDLPIEVPPGGEREVACRFLPAATGETRYEGPVYTDHPAYPSLELKITGTTLAKPES